MASVTGQYDVVVEVSVGALNGILAAVHANQHPGYPTMPHSLSLFVDDAHRGEADPVPEPERTGIRSRVEVQVSTPTVSLPVDTLVVRPEVASLAPRRVEGASGPGPAVSRSLAGDGPAPAEPGGGAFLGLFPPPTPFAAPRITARVRVRAWVRDPTDPALPGFVDGDVFVTSALVRSDVPGVGTFVTIDRSYGPLVTFRPSPGAAISPDQAQVIGMVVRNVIRGDAEPSTFRVSLPPEVSHFDYKLQPEARVPCVLLMLALAGTSPGPEARNSVSAGLLPDGADFAVGVGRDHVLDLLGSRLFQGVPDRYSYSKWGVSATIRHDWPGASFDLEPGRIVFSLSGDGDISWWGLNDHFTFSVRQSFRLNVVGGGLEPVADGDPQVDLHDVAVGGGYIEGKARDTIREQRDAALAAAAPELKEALDLAKHVETILAGINPTPSGVTLAGVDVRPDGVVVTGNIGLAVSGPVVVGQVARSGFNDALESWIPGGTIERFLWERYPSPPADARVEDRRFVTEAIVGRLRGGFCLTVEGTRVTPGGGVTQVSGSACFPFLPIFPPIGGMSDERPRPLLPLTETETDGGIHVIGHYDPWAAGRVPAGGHASLLLHFGSDGGEVTSVLGEALRARRKSKGAILAVGIVRDGGIGRTAESRSPDPEDLLLVDDPDGRWAEAFGVADIPATVLVGPRGDVAWKDTSAVTAKQLARALDEHAAEGGELALYTMGLAVRLNDRPPDVPLRLADGSELSLRRLSGRGVVLAFWTLRSRPSMENLELLRDMNVARDRSSPLVVAVGDGESQDRVAAIVDEKRLPFLAVPDPDRLISRSFGIWCWPVTVWIRPDQRIEAIDIGVAASTKGQV